MDGNATVGGAGAGAVTVGESAGDTALFATSGTLAIDGSGQIALSGANATVRASALDIAAGGLLSGAGTLSGEGGGNGTMMLASIANDGSIAASGGNLLLYGGVAGTGELSVATGATITLQAAIGAGQTLAFSPNAQAVLDDPLAFAGMIAGFGTGDVLDLASTDATGATWSNGVLTLNTATGAIQLNLAGTYAPNAFAVNPDGFGGTDVTMAPNGGGQGDVHMLTFDGLHYDFQAVGKFVAARSTEPGNPFQVQIQNSISERSRQHYHRACRGTRRRPRDLRCRPRRCRLGQWRAGHGAAQRCRAEPRGRHAHATFVECVSAHLEHGRGGYRQQCGNLPRLVGLARAP